ncbi:hypothetical protein ABK040_003028 [Willaertia magna]
MQFVKFSFLVVLLLSILSSSFAFKGLPILHTPKSIDYSGNVVPTNGGFPITLTYSDADTLPPTIVLDYGENVGGYPYFDITSTSGNTTLRVSYSETLPSIVNGDMDFFPLIHAFDLNRVNTYTITSMGRLDSSFIQGAQRYQRLTLTTKGSISLSAIGIESAYYVENNSGLQGTFSCSSALYDKLWKMGARTLQLNMIPPRTVQPGFIATDQGLYLSPGQRGVYLRGMKWVNYVATFSAMIMRNGVTFSIRSNDFSEVAIVINSQQESNTNYANTIQLLSRQELHPPVSLILNTSIPIPISQHTWYKVQASLNELALIVSINDNIVLTTQLPGSSNPYIPSVTPGGVGFSTSKSQSAFVKDLTVIDLSGNTLYKDSLTSKKAASDFGVGTNELPVILDGAKRDRNVWAGDLLVGGPALYYSFYANEYISGSIALGNSYQLTSGPVASRVGTGFPYQRTAPSDDFVTPIFYSYTYFLATLNTLDEYYLYTGDIDFVKNQWPRMKHLIDSFDALVGSDGLIVGQNPNWGYDFAPSIGIIPGKFTKLNIQYAMALDDAASLATAVGETTLPTQYLKKADAVRKAINNSLFSTTTNTYIISDQMKGIAQDTNAFAILAGLTKLRGENATNNLLDIMQSTLRVPTDSGNGYLTFTSEALPSYVAPFISPYISYFHAAAAFEANRTDMAFDIMNSVWTPMSKEGPYYTGTFWESASPNSYPGASTSFAHAWSAGVTALLSKYVVGIKPTSPGYATWSIRPQPGPLDWANGSAATPYGILSVSWNNTKVFVMNVDVPPKTKGTVLIPTSESCVVVNGVNMNQGAITTSNTGIEKVSRDGVYLAVSITTPGYYTIAGSKICNGAISVLLFDFKVYIIFALFLILI